MRRVVIGLAAFALLWLAPLPAAHAAVATALYPVQTDDLSPRVAGRATEVSVHLFTDQAGLPGQKVTLKVRPYGASGFSVVGTATTDATGLASVWLRLDHNATVQWTFAGDDPTYAGSTSTPYTLLISPRVDLRVKDRTLHRGQRLVARGRTFPANAGCTVKLWRGELRPLVQGPKPVRLAVSRVRSDGSYRLAHRFHKVARTRIAVTVAPCAGNDRGLSSYVRIRVR